MTETGREGMHMDKPQRKWLVRHAGDHGIYDNTDDELFDVVERGPYGLITIAAEHDRDTARLIAAAPDLVEALRDLSIFYGDDTEAREVLRSDFTGPEPLLMDDDALRESVWNNARAALSKALGRTVTK